MARVREFVEVGEAARRLGVSPRHVTRLVEMGWLTGVARGLVDAISVERYRLEGHHGRTRAWSEATAWGAVALLVGARVEWLGQAQASRLRAALRAMTDPADLVSRCRDRAAVRTYSGHRSVLDRLRGQIVVPNSEGLGLAPAGGLDGYLAAGDAPGAVRRFALREDPAGTITLRATGFVPDTVARLARAGPVLAALDAASSLDPRVRGVGRRALGDALDSFRAV
jgi:hypothetical protein